jgi:hypothetical protein
MSSSSIPRKSALSIERYLRETDVLLSRTVRTGRIDVAASDQKQQTSLTAEALQAAVERNRLRISEFIAWRAMHLRRSSDELLAALLAIAQLAMADIVPRGVFREWPYEHRKYLDASADDGCPSEQATELTSDIDLLVPIAELEWELVLGPVHPFYDGVGRISRYYSTLVCLGSGLLPRMHSSREQYFLCGRGGREAFCSYYRALPVAPQFLTGH